MKKSLQLTVVILLLVTTSASAQTSEDRYNRAGLTVMHIAYDDSEETKLGRYIDSFTYDARYDKNQIPVKSLNFGLERTYKEKNYKGEMVNKVRMITDRLTEELNSRNIGLQIVSTIFNRKPDGKMDLELLHYRGGYNSTDQNYLQSVATKRGAEALQETGETLIDNSYIAVFDILNYDEKKVTKEDNSSTYYECSGSVITYLYKINWNEELLNQIWDCWIDEDTTQEEYPARIRAFESIQVPVEYINCYSTDLTTSSVDVKKDNYKALSFEEFMRNKVIGASFTNLESKNEAISLKTAIYATKPIRAKIGTKEGVKTDYSFYVYENVLGSDNVIKKKRVGVIMATNNIAANSFVTTGDTKPTEFYQYAGRKVEAGQTMVEKKLAHMSLFLGYSGYFGNTSSAGAHIGLGYDRFVSRHTQLFISAAGNIAGSGYNFGLNLGYGLRMNNFQLYPLVGIYYDVISGLDDIDGMDDKYKKSNNAFLGQVGVKTNINIAYPVQLFLHAGYNAVFGQGDRYSDNIGKRDINGLFANAGLRLCF